MKTINFKFENNKDKINEYLESISYTKIGSLKKDAVGYTILINEKKYFEIDFMLNKTIWHTNDINHIKQYCI